MTTEEKFLKLLQIAESRGWKSNFIQKITSPDFIIDTQRCVITTAPIKEERTYGWEFQFRSKEFSINDIIINHEPNQISFIDAISFGLVYWTDERDVFDNHKPQPVPAYHFRDVWIYLTTSKRVKWLIETFSHLLIFPELLDKKFENCSIYKYRNKISILQANKFRIDINIDQYYGNLVSISICCLLNPKILRIVKLLEYKKLISYEIYKQDLHINTRNMIINDSKVFIQKLQFVINLIIKYL